MALLPLVLDLAAVALLLQQYGSISENLECS